MPLLYASRKRHMSSLHASTSLRIELKEKKNSLEEMTCVIVVCFENETCVIIACILQFEDPTFIL